MFPWAKFRQKKGAVKLHLLLDHEGYLPTFACITEGKTHEVNIAQTLKLPPGSIVAMDRGYNDYEMYYDWTLAGVYFVTQQKRNAVFDVIEERKVPKNRNIRADQVILFNGPLSSQKCPIPIRRIVVWVPEKEQEIALLTNHFTFGASTISSIYKERWEIEVFFKTLKQNLKVKTFVGTSPNALRIQIWTALIAILLIKYLKFKATLGWSFSNLVALLRWNLFTYRDLWDWINDPFLTPPINPNQQLFLPFLDSISTQGA
jgi:IS4 transposase